MDTIVGLYQTIKGLLPIAIFQTRTKFLSNVFDPESSRAMLINKKTLKLEPTDISEKSRSRWITDDGLEETINKLSQDAIKNSPIVIDDHYLLLVYDDGKEIRIINDIDKLPTDKDKKHVRPITYGELFYLSIFDIVKEYPAYLTRYPVTEYGSIVPVTVYLKSTVKGRKVNVWLPGAFEPKKAIEYPIVGTKYLQSMAPPTKHLERLGADMDGDKCSLNFEWSEDSKKELMDLLHSRKYYITPNGEVAFSADNLTNEILMKVLTA